MKQPTITIEDTKHTLTLTGDQLCVVSCTAQRAAILHAGEVVAAEAITDPDERADALELCEEDLARTKDIYDMCGPLFNNESSQDKYELTLTGLQMRVIHTLCTRDADVLISKLVAAQSIPLFDPDSPLIPLGADREQTIWDRTEDLTRVLEIQRMITEEMIISRERCGR